MMMNVKIVLGVDMSNNKVVTFALGNDWTGMYVDGVLVTEGHSIPYWDIVKALGFEYKSVTADEEYLEEYGCMPDDLKDICRISG